MIKNIYICVSKSCFYLKNMQKHICYIVLLLKPGKNNLCILLFIYKKTDYKAYSIEQVDYVIW